MRTRSGIKTKWVNQVVEADIVVVGGGLAATNAAIEAQKKLGEGGTVALIDKGRVGSSGQSAFAAAVFSIFDHNRDDFDVWMEETVRQGEYLADQAWIAKQFEETLPAVEEIDQWASRRRKTAFLRDDQGELARRKSRGHIETCHSLVNTHDLMDVLRREVIASGVEVIEHTMATDILAVDGVPAGVVGLNHISGDLVLVVAPVVILASSGSGFKSVYFGHRPLTGDMQAAASRLGAELVGMEMYAGNTTCRNFDVHGLNLYVSIGGQFRNKLGDPFLEKYQPQHGSRANLQHVIMAFCREVEAGRAPIQLDITAASMEDRKLARQMLPDTFMVWDRAGIDPFEQPIDWIVAPHPGLFSGGGLKIDTAAETTIRNVFACGDITNTPVHGTYAYGGLNLAFCVVSGREAGRSAAARINGGDFERPSPARLTAAQENLVANMTSPLGARNGDAILEATRMLQEAILPYDFAYIKHAVRLDKALARAQEVRDEIVPTLTASNPHELMRVLELRSMAEIANAMIASSLFREESRGFHFREEFPMTDNLNWHKWVVSSRSDSGEYLPTAHPVPSPYVSPIESYSSPPGTISEPVGAGAEGGGGTS